MGDPQNSSETHSEGRSGDAQPTSTSGRHDAVSPSCKRRRTGGAPLPARGAAAAAAPPAAAPPGGRYNLSAAAAHLRPQIFQTSNAAPDAAALLRTLSGRCALSPTGLPRLHSSQQQNASLAPSTDAWQPALDEAGDAPPRLSSNEIVALATAQQALKQELAPDDLLLKLRSTIKQIEQSLASERSSGLSAMTGAARQRSALEQVTAVLNAQRSLGLHSDAAAASAAASLRSTRLEDATSAAASFSIRKPPVAPVRFLAVRCSVTAAHAAVCSLSRRGRASECERQRAGDRRQHSGARGFRLVPAQRCDASAAAHVSAAAAVAEHGAAGGDAAAPFLAAERCTRRKRDAPAAAHAACTRDRHVSRASHAHHGADCGVRR